MAKETIYDIAIIGAGTMGMAAGAYLAEKKQRTLLIDAFDPPHTNGSHHGDTRMIRHAYGEGRQYVDLVKRAQQLWEKLEKQTGLTIFEQTGVIGLGAKDSAFMKETIEAASTFNLPLEVLSNEQINERWPGFKIPENFIGCFEETSGFIYSENAIRAYKQMALEHGAELVTNTPVQQIEKNEHGNVMMTTESRTFYAKKVIVTVGAWAQRLLPDLALPIQPTRKVFGWFEAEEDLYQTGKLPAFYIENETEMCYGFPSVDNTGLKIGRNDGGQAINPDEHKQNFGKYNSDEADLRRFLQKFIPHANQKLVQGKTCMYTNSKDNHFIIDTHPNDDAIIFACGFSGHGFKFASSLGEALGELAMFGKTTYDLSNFSLARFK